MKTLLSIFLFFTTVIYSQSINQNVYLALSDSSEVKLVEQINLLEKADSSSSSKAYLGALYMKQASFLKSVNAKIKTFKKGRFLLEEEIKAHQHNMEYRLLRLMIQENAPSILKYNKDIDLDLKAIYQNYNLLSPELKKQVFMYSKNSKYLDGELLKE